jgi:hypothetical protein
MIWLQTRGDAVEDFISAEDSCVFGHAGSFRVREGGISMTAARFAQAQTAGSCFSAPILYSESPARCKTRRFRINLLRTSFQLESAPRGSREPPGRPYVMPW